MPNVLRIFPGGQRITPLYIFFSQVGTKNCLFSVQAAPSSHFHLQSQKRWPIILSNPFSAKQYILMWNHFCPTTSHHITDILNQRRDEDMELEIKWSQDFIVILWPLTEVKHAGHNSSGEEAVPYSLVVVLLALHSFLPDGMQTIHLLSGHYYAGGLFPCTCLCIRHWRWVHWRQWSAQTA